MSYKDKSKHLSASYDPYYSKPTLHGNVGVSYLKSGVQNEGQAAANAQAQLMEARGCVNCVDCTDCYSCIKCTESVNSVNCKRSSHLSHSASCSDSSYLTGCLACDRSKNLRDRIRVNDCDGSKETGKLTVDLNLERKTVLIKVIQDLLNSTDCWPNSINSFVKEDLKKINCVTERVLWFKTTKNLKIFSQEKESLSLTIQDLLSEGILIPVTTEQLLSKNIKYNAATYYFKGVSDETD